MTFLLGCCFTKKENLISFFLISIYNFNTSSGWGGGGQKSPKSPIPVLGWWDLGGVREVVGWDLRGPWSSPTS